MKKLLLITTCLTLSGCVTGPSDLFQMQQPSHWTAKRSDLVKEADAKTLIAWWKKFEDPTLDQLVDLSLEKSPDRLIAETKILEARGLRRSSRSFLFPQIGASGNGGREETSMSDAANFYDARFDASFEVDVFGRNRKNVSATQSQLEAAQASYHDVSLSLIAEVTRTYIDYRAAQNQMRIADKNLQSQEKTLTLIQDLHRLGAAPRLDVERAENLVNTTRASLPEFSRQVENARLRLSVLTGSVSEDLIPILKEAADIPGSDVQPVLMAPAQVLAQRPDVQAAISNLAARTSLTEAAAAELFPTFTISGFYGIVDNALVNSTSIWSIAAGVAVNLLDFGRIEGKIDAAKAREKQAFEQYRKVMLSAVTEVEMALNDYAHINEQGVSLQRAYDSADKALELSKILYKEGEISFLDVLDAQRTANKAESELVSSKAAKAESLTRLYKSLGVY